MIRMVGLVQLLHVSLGNLHASVTEGGLNDVHTLLRSGKTSATDCVVLLTIHGAVGVCDGLHVLERGWNAL